MFTFALTGERIAPAFIQQPAAAPTWNPRPVGGRDMAVSTEILVVDDEVDLCEIVAEYLARHGFVVRAAMDGVDSIVHFAAESHVDRSIMDSGPFIRTNVLGTQILLDAARAAGVRRFVQVSTDEVYGSLGPTGLFTEETPLAPNSPYSASKAAADLLVCGYVHTFDFPAIITRCSWWTRRRPGARRARPSKDCAPGRFAAKAPSCTSRACRPSIGCAGASRTSPPAARQPG